MNLRILLAVPVCLVTQVVTSCAPIPSTTLVAPKVGGFVVSQKTGEPIRGAKITSSRAGYSKTEESNKDGFFAVPPLTQWHFLVYAGDPGVAPAPWWCSHSHEPLEITASAKGFETFHDTFPPSKELSLAPMPRLPRTLTIRLTLLKSENQSKSTSKP